MAECREQWQRGNLRDPLHWDSNPPRVEGGGRHSGTPRGVLPGNLVACLFIFLMRRFVSIRFAPPTFGRTLRYDLEVIKKIISKSFSLSPIQIENHGEE